MAKKKEAATPEQRLQEALVPCTEWPYKVPENWCWVKLGSINQYLGRSITPANSPDETFELYSVPSSAENFPEIVSGSEVGSSKQSVQKDDVLLCKINPRINRVWKVSQHTDHTLLASSEWIIVRNPKLVSDYLMWVFKSNYFREYMLSNVSGVGGSLMRAQPKYVQSYPVPLPPLSEQQRIVERIENLFSQLDEAKEKAQAALDSFEPRKAAILHRAFTGELTAKWREEHGVGMESWKQLPINEVCSPRAGYAFDSKLFSNSGYRVIRMGNLFAGELDLSRNPVFYSTENLDAKILKRALINEGDILLTLTGTKYKRDYGYAVRIEHPNHLLVNQRILCLTPISIVSQYLLYFLRSDIFRDVFFSNETGGVSQGNVSSKFVENILVPVPSEIEQIEISNILDSLLAKEQQAKEAAEAVLEQIDLVKKAILSRAFRGELGTNDPSEKSAVELLKEIFAKKG